MMNNFGLYIHIPFCRNRCNYCDFNKSLNNNDNFIKRYINRVIEELNYYKNYLNQITTIYIGGGTPNSIPINELDRLLNKLDNINKKEFTIELNPEYIDLELIKILKKHNVNRVSIGVQTFNDKNLKYLGRSHNKETVFNAIKLLKKEGFFNINIDLIFGIPNTNLEDIKKDLDIFIKLDVPHLSYYSLILEKGTPFFNMYKNNKFKKINQDLEADMYKYIINYLKKHNYIHYEISNFCKKGYESKHNLIYWNMNPYIGIGLSASGFLNNKRYYNNDTFYSYYKSFKKREDLLTKNDLLFETIILNLRTNKGIDINKLEKAFNINLFKKYPKIKEMIDLKLLKINKNNLMLTQKGVFLSNQVYQIFT